uniref:Putative reverse transcriptase domain-containing protein n=1 Tax=Tanacetum cinerariifolium TaxID=118510 RepID=A0A6L2LIF5_TANCI|nr:putative reverse transcriptase domain-containing protein [Tanacetum cinerariifolium]
MEMMAIMEMVEMEMAEMEMAKMEMVGIEIQMRIIGPVVRECTYQDFMKCQPLNFKGTKGVVGLIRWFEKMETIMVLEEEDRIERYVGGLPDNIQGNVMSVEPTRLQDAIRLDNSLMDQKLKGYAVKNAKNKRRLEVIQRHNRRQQPPFKRPNVESQNVARAYTAGNNKRRPYNGPLPLYNKCKLHHEGPCTVRCKKCNKVGHLTQDCKVTIFTTSTQRGHVVNQRVVTCFEHGRQGRYKSDYPKLKDQNRRNKAENKNGVGEAREKAYVLGRGDANLDSNVVKGTFLLNNHYASMIFDSGADRSFVSTTFSTLLEITIDNLDASYVVELADGRISKTNTVPRGCTLANHHVVIVCDEKVVQIPYGDEVFDSSSYEERTVDKSNEKRLEDVPTIRDFLEVFPEDLPGLLPTRQVEFQINLVPGAAPVARTPYRLAPTELQELSTQLQELSDKRFIRPSSENFVVYCDASRKGLGTVLMQREKMVRVVSVYDYEIRYHPRKANVVVDALIRKERIKLLRVRALVMTIGLNLPVQILDAQVDARKDGNYGTEDLCGMIKNLEQRIDGTLCLNRRCWIPCRGFKEAVLVVEYESKDCYLCQQKSYADRRRKPLEFKVRDKVMLKVSPWKGVIRFGKRGKLNPRYIGPFKILVKVGTLAYQLELAEQLSRVHSTFHVFNLKKCFVDEPLAIPLDKIQIDDKLNFIKEPVEIMDREVKQLKQSRIPIVKARWNSRRGPGFTWEREDQMKKKYPHLFVNPSSTS